MTQFTEAMLKAALAQSFGIKSRAAEILGVSRQAVGQRMTPELIRYVDQIEEAMIDAAEEVLVEAVLEGDRQMSRWVATNHPKGRRRGWGQRLEVTGPEGGPVQVAGAVTVTVVYVEADAEGDPSAPAPLPAPADPKRRWA